MKHERTWAFFLFAAMALMLLTTATQGWAEGDEDMGMPFDEAFVFFELNNTDGDLGIHAKIDGDAWVSLEIEGPDGRQIFNVNAGARLFSQGLTEIFFESAEPTFDELSPEEFFKRFPAGIYAVEGETQSGEELESETEVAHAMPAPAGGIFLNGEADTPILKDRCDDESDEFDPTQVTATNGGTVTIEWDEVTQSHPTLGSPNAAPIEIHNYEVVVEIELEMENGEDFTSVFSVTLPPDQTSMTIPAEVLGLSEDGFVKYEILARALSYNQTAVESCFLLQ